MSAVDETDAPPGWRLTTNGRAEKLRLISSTVSLEEAHRLARQHAKPYVDFALREYAEHAVYLGLSAEEMIAELREMGRSK